MATRFASARGARLKRHGDGRPVLAVLAAVVLRAAKEGAVKETLTKESNGLQFDQERAEGTVHLSLGFFSWTPGIVEAVREAKQQQLVASDVLRERELITDEASTLQAGISIYLPT